LFTIISQHDIIVLLIKHGADCYLKNNKGITVADLALKSSNPSIVELFSHNFDIKEPAED
jgi:ankyrin repeat protein